MKEVGWEMIDKIVKTMLPVAVVAVNITSSLFLKIPILLIDGLENGESGVKGPVYLDPLWLSV